MTLTSARRPAQDLDHLLAGDGEDPRAGVGGCSSGRDLFGVRDVGRRLGRGLGQPSVWPSASSPASGRERPTRDAVGRPRSIIGCFVASVGIGRLGRSIPDPGPRTSSANTSSNDGRASWIEVTRRALGLDARDHRGRRSSSGPELRTCSRRGAMPPDSSTPRSRAEAVDVDRVGRLDLQELPAERAGGAAPRVVERDSRPSAIRATTSHSSASGTYWVVISERPAGVAQAVELAPDALADERVDPGGRLVEEDQLGVVDERARELQPAAHAARQVAGAVASARP